MYAVQRRQIQEFSLIKYFFYLFLSDQWIYTKTIDYFYVNIEFFVAYLFYSYWLNGFIQIKKKKHSAPRSLQRRSSQNGYFHL